jgi:hypothetical protein
MLMILTGEKNMRLGVTLTRQERVALQHAAA